MSISSSKSFCVIETANLVLFIVDIREGLVPLDETTASLLRKHGLDVIGVANKADTAKVFPAAVEFSKLGFGEFVCVSAQNNLNKAVLLDKIFEKLEVLESPGVPPEPVMKIAIVGKRNAGKSTLVNSIVGEERVIVSETPGTTRDAVDVRFDKDGKTIVVIDTGSQKGQQDNGQHRVLRPRACHAIDKTCRCGFADNRRDSSHCGSR